MACIVCGSSSRSLAETVNGFGLLRCVQCRLVFCSPVPTQEELDAYYQGFAYARPTPSQFAEQVAYTEAGALRLLGEINELTQHPVRKMLDFGGGLGFFANAFAQHYPAVTLFDLDATARAFAREQFADRFRVVDKAKDAFADQYDLILLNQVIEHVPDPVTFLSYFRGVLAPGGLLIVTTPNNDAVDTLIRPDVIWHYARRLKFHPLKAVWLLFSDSWVCCDPPRHLFAFNPLNLALLGQRAGFDGLRTSTSFFDEDALGQPKYSYRGFWTTRAALESFLFVISKFSARLGRLADPRRNRGSTLTALFSVTPI